MKDLAWIPHTKIIWFCHPLWQHTHRKWTLISDMVKFPQHVTMLNVVNGLVQLCCILPWCIVSKFHNCCGPHIKGLVYITFWTLNLNKMIMWKVKFSPRPKWMPRVQRSTSSRHMGWWWSVWREEIAIQVARNPYHIISTTQNWGESMSIPFKCGWYWNMEVCLQSSSDSGVNCLWVESLCCVNPCPDLHLRKHIGQV